MRTRTRSGRGYDMKAEDISRATNHALIGNEITLTLPPTALEAIARRVLELLAEEGSANGAASLPEYLNVEEAAEYLRCSKQRIYDLLSARRLPKYRDGSRVLLKRSDLDSYLEAA